MKYHIPTYYTLLELPQKILKTIEIIVEFSFF